MTHDSNRSALTRRDLLKHVALAGSMSVSGAAADGVVSATETPEHTTGIPDDYAETQFGKELTVKGLGTGVNEYHIKTKGNIRLDEISATQDAASNEREFNGGLRKGYSDSYFFTGRVTNVYARGSIIYSVSNHD